MLSTTLTFEDDKGYDGYLFLRNELINYENIGQQGKIDKVGYSSAEYRIYVLSKYDINIEGLINNLTIVLNRANYYSAKLISTNTDARLIVKEVTGLDLKTEWNIVEFKFLCRERLMLTNCLVEIC